MKINKLSGLILVFSITEPLHGQWSHCTPWFGISASAGPEIRLGNKDLNYIYRQYNKTRSFLTNKLQPSVMNTGYKLGIRYFSNYFCYEICYQQNSGRQFSEGRGNNGIFQRRYIQNIESGYGIALGMNNVLQFSIFGITVDKSTFRLRSRVGKPDEVKSLPWDKVATFNYINTGVYIHTNFQVDCKKWAMVQLEWYFKMAPFKGSKFSLTDVNKYLNPNTWQNDPDNLTWRSVSTGIRIKLIMGKGKTYDE